mmetsp:Transcript_18687/g.27827  ORF Transcript_18687/g.27827 Transcript_18687/m.27827 type:complete len:221 (-) Transcript_18687:1125-1787(-)
MILGRDIHRGDKNALDFLWNGVNLLERATAFNFIDHGLRITSSFPKCLFKMLVEVLKLDIAAQNIAVMIGECKVWFNTTRNVKHHSNATCWCNIGERCITTANALWCKDRLIPVWKDALGLGKLFRHFFGSFLDACHHLATNIATFFRVVRHTKTIQHISKSHDTKTNAAIVAGSFVDTIDWKLRDVNHIIKETDGKTCHTLQFIILNATIGVHKFFKVE